MSHAEASCLGFTVSDNQIEFRAETGISIYAYIFCNSENLAKIYNTKAFSLISIYLMIIIITC